MKRNVIKETISTLFIILFLYASVSKLTNYEGLKSQIQQSPMLTANASTIAWLVPTIELLVVLMFLIGRLQKAAMYASLCLMSIFTTYIVIILKFSDYIPCSCGGILQKMSWSTHLLFNSAFVLLALLSIVLELDAAKPTIT